MIVIACHTNDSDDAGVTGTTANAEGTSPTPTTEIVPKCGNRVVEDNEECDDGNDIPYDHCNDCLNRNCGDGIVQNGENCDDGNNDETDTCRNSCIGPVCGDSIVQVGEECDEGSNNADTKPCLTTCKWTTCGDGFVCPEKLCHGGEECDEGANNDNYGTCKENCRLSACGDGYLGPKEECDDGNPERFCPVGGCHQGFCLNMPQTPCNTDYPNPDAETCSSSCKIWPPSGGP